MIRRVLLTVALMGCSEGTSPAPPHLSLGAFLLQSVDGLALPQRVTISLSNCSTFTPEYSRGAVQREVKSLLIYG